MTGNQGPCSTQRLTEKMFMLLNVRFLEFSLSAPGAPLLRIAAQPSLRRSPQNALPVTFQSAGHISAIRSRLSMSATQRGLAAFMSSQRRSLRRCRKGPLRLHCEPQPPTGSESASGARGSLQRQVAGQICRARTPRNLLCSTCASVCPELPSCHESLPHLHAEKAAPVQPVLPTLGLLLPSLLLSLHQNTC